MHQPRISQRGFACCTRADPATAWSVLTEANQTGSYLYGLAAHSSWEAEATITFETGHRGSLTGQVLHVDKPNRLSYVLQSGRGDPAAYLTWEIRPNPGGSTITLRVDEIDSPDDGEAENVWLPVLAALQHTLATAHRPVT